MSAFTAEVVDLAANVGEQFGDPFTLLPRAKAADPNAPDIVDASRASVAFIGVFLDPQVKPLIRDAYDPRTDQRPGTMAGGPRIDIMPDVIAGGLVVKVPDLLQSQTTGKTWRVTSIFVAKTGICRCNVNLVG